MITEIMVKKNDKTISVGMDDTFKDGGRHLYYAKTDLIAVRSPSQGRRTFTKGY